VKPLALRVAALGARWLWISVLVLMLVVTARLISLVGQMQDSAALSAKVAQFGVFQEQMASDAISGAVLPRPTANDSTYQASVAHARGIEEELTEALGPSAPARLELILKALEEISALGAGFDRSNLGALADAAVPYVLASGTIMSEINGLLDELGTNGSRLTAELREQLLLGLVALAVASAASGVGFGWSAQRTRRLRQEVEKRAASESERELFVAMAESMEAGLLIVDSRDEITYCNDRFASFFGVSVDEVLNRQHSVLRRLARVQLNDPETLRRLDEAYERARLPHGMYRETVELHVAAPEERVLQLSVFPLHDREGSYVGRGQFVRDTTRQAAIDRMKTEFVALASHELRTPLTGIYGFSQLLTEVDNWDDSAREWATHIHTEAGRLTSIIDDLLSVSRIESGDLVVATERVGSR
jgi:PAS domain S-box-containing protein